MTKDEETAIQTVVRDELTQFFSIDKEKHRREHDYLNVMIQRDRRKTERIEKIKTQTIGAAVIAFGGSILAGLAWVGTFVLEHWDKGGHQ